MSGKVYYTVEIKPVFLLALQKKKKKKNRELLRSTQIDWCRFKDLDIVNFERRKWREIHTQGEIMARK